MLTGDLKLSTTLKIKLFLMKHWYSQLLKTVSTILCLLCVIGYCCFVFGVKDSTTVHCTNIVSSPVALHLFYFVSGKSLISVVNKIHEYKFCKC